METDLIRTTVRGNERIRIQQMLDTVKQLILESSLDHNAPSDWSATDTILDVLKTVSDGLVTGISVNMFRHLYPEQATPETRRT